MGFLFGGGGGKKQAAAIKETAAAEAKAAREAARGAQLTQETMLAQDRASRSAAELLSRPSGTPEVDLESAADLVDRTRFKGASRPTPGSAPSSGSASGDSAPRRNTRFRLPTFNSGLRI